MNSLKDVFNNQKFILVFTGLISLIISINYYFFMISDYPSLWIASLFFDSYTLWIMAWILSIVMVHLFTRPEYIKQFMESQ